jgi:hypothetical protein
MSANPPETERPHNPTHFGGDGLYESAGNDDSGSLGVTLGDQLDSATRRALLNERGASTRDDYARRNRLPLLLVAGGIAALLVALTRRSMRG